MLISTFPSIIPITAVLTRASFSITCIHLIVFLFIFFVDEKPVDFFYIL